MLRLMLEGHPELAIPPETHFIPRLLRVCADAEDPAGCAVEAIVGAERWASFGLDGEALRSHAVTQECRSAADVLRLFYGSYAASRGKPRWGDKTPFYVLNMPLIASVLEEAHFIHLIRDGRDVAVSVIPMWWGPDSMSEAAAWWAERIRAGRRASADLPYLEVRYEQLVERPEAELQRICAFIALEFDARMLSFAERVREQPATVAPHLVELKLDAGTTVTPQEMQARLAARLSGPPDTASVGRWRTLMTPDDVRSFDEVAGDLLAELGYPLA